MQKVSTPAVLQTPVSATERIYRFWAWQLLAWTLYRYFFSFPEPVDEFIVKPLVFILPVIWYLSKHEHRTVASIGLTAKNLWPAILTGLGFGAVFLAEGAISNVAKYGSFVPHAIKSVDVYGIPMLVLLSLGTAFSEELLNRGFLFSRLYEATRNLLYSTIMSALLFVAFHIPILVTSLKFHGITLIVFFWTTLLLGVINAVLYHHQKNLAAPILVHMLWNITVALFL